MNNEIASTISSETEESQNAESSVHIKRKTFQFTLFRLTLIMVAFTALAIGIPVYVNTRSAAIALARELMQETANGTTDKASVYLAEANSVLRYSRDLLQTAPGLAALSDSAAAAKAWRKRAVRLLQLLQSEPSLESLYFGDRYGTLIMATRMPDGRFEIDHRRLEEGPPKRERFRVGTDGTWTPVLAEKLNFDPRQRIWYQRAAAVQGIVWTDPYIFAGSNAPGVTTAIAVRNPKGEVVGVVGVDHSLRELSAYVHGLHPAQEGKVMLFAWQDGKLRVVAQPDTTIPINANASEKGLLPEASSLSPMTRAAGEWFLRRQEAPGAQNQEMAFTSNGTRFFGAANPFVLDQLHWTIVIAIPEYVILGVVTRNILITLLCCLIGLAAAAILGRIFASRISDPLRAYSAEMRRLQNLEFADAPLPHSDIYELEVTRSTLESLKIGLRAFASYVPVDLVRAVLKSHEPQGLGVTNVPVTVCFADIVNFTSAAERLKPDELIETLALYLENLEEVIWQHAGIVDKYIGDAVLALWDAPIRQSPDSAIQACRAALEIRRRVGMLREERSKANLPFFDIAVGLHSGAALVGNVGSLRRYNYTAMGDTVNVSSRLEGLNRVYGTRILISEALYRQVQDQFEVRLIDHVAVKGRKEPMRIYELLSAKGELPPELLPLLQSYREGWDLYQARQWAQAAERLQTALDLSQGEDRPSRIFLERCREYQSAAPPADWDGVTVFTQK